MKKRILSLVLTVAMLVSVLAMVGASASAECNLYEYGCDHEVVGDLLRLYRVRCGCTSTYTCVYHRDYYNRLNCTRYWDSSTSSYIYPCRNDNTWFTATVGAYGKVARGSTVGDTYYTTVSDYTDWANISVGPATVNGKNVTYSIQRADRHYWCRDYDLVNGNNGSFWLEDGRNVFKVTATVDGTAPVDGSISIDPSKLTLEVGESATIEAVLKNLPVDGKVSWETEGKKFVSINAQNPLKPTVYGDEAGVENVKITYTYGGATYTATCEVTVVDPTAAPVPADGITLDKSSVSLRISNGVAQGVKLTATVTPENAEDKSVTWTSSNEKVATVDANGEVLAVGEGKTTVTATTVNGKFATCEVDVSVEHKLELVVSGSSDPRAKNVELKCDGKTVDASDYELVFDAVEKDGSIIENPGKDLVTCVANRSNGYWFQCAEGVTCVSFYALYNGERTAYEEVYFDDATSVQSTALDLVGELPVIETPVEPEPDVVENSFPGPKPGAPEAPKTNVYTFYVVIDKNYEKTLPTYTISTECSVGGKVSNDEVTVRRGDDATIKFTANAGYTVSSVVVDGVEQGAITSYTFKDVVKNHSIKVTFVPVEIIPEAPVAFSDIPTTHWAYTYIQSLVNAGIINGYEDGTFKPNNSVTWGEALKLVLRVAGYSEQTAPAGQYWATGYMNLAISQGILADVVDLRAPIDRLSMAQLASKALELSAPTVASPFADCSNAAVVALYEAGIITGSNVAGSTVYNPDSSLTRAEFAAIIYRMRELG